jgi:hypothetical protein
MVPLAPRNRNLLVVYRTKGSWDGHVSAKPLFFGNVDSPEPWNNIFGFSVGPRTVSVGYPGGKEKRLATSTRV